MASWGDQGYMLENDRSGPGIGGSSQSPSDTRLFLIQPSQFLNLCVLYCQFCSESSAGEESACNAGGPGSIPGLGRSPGEGKGYSLQYLGPENSMDCRVHGIAKSWTRLSDFHFTSLYMVNTMQEHFNFYQGIWLSAISLSIES